MKRKILAEIKVQAYTDREAVVTALVNAGYRVSVREKNKRHLLGSGDFYVIIEEADHQEGRHD